MDLLGEDSDSNNDASESLTINKTYAQSYEKWRKKEERQKLIDKYGEGVESESSSEEEEEIRSTPQLDKDWLRAYAVVRFNQPRLYTGERLFHGMIKPVKKKVEKGETLKDYERRFILEKGGIESNEESDAEEQQLEDRKSYFEEQEEIKDSFKAALRDSDDEDEDEEKGSLLVRQTKTKEQQAKEENDYLEWLKGEREDLEDEQAVQELAPLKAYWNDPNLSEKERVLRDYILNNGYMDKEESDDESESDEGPDFGEEEKFLDEAEEYEHRYNFRHEEPGGTEIKSYPRMIETSVRMKDSRRAEKRQRRMEKKNQEKKEKQDEIRLLQKLQKEEKEEKLRQLRKISQNPELNYDLEADFDPEEHKKIMDKYFNEHYYDEDDRGKKPVFEFDQAVDDETDDWWYKRNQLQMAEENEKINTEDAEEDEVYGEKFIMDADYDSNVDYKSKTRRDKKKKGKKAAKKPAFDPSSKSFDEFVDEYLKDRIPTLPFPYREVVPNDFGLSTAEILTAPDRELNSWVSVKKMSMYRSSCEEQVDLNKFKAKAQNLTSKYKKMPSLLPDPPRDDDSIKKNKKKKKKQTKDSSDGEEPGKEEGENESSLNLKNGLDESTRDMSSGAKRKGQAIDKNSTPVKKRRKITKEKDKGMETEVQDTKKKKKKAQKNSDSSLAPGRNLKSHANTIDVSHSVIHKEPKEKNRGEGFAKKGRKGGEKFVSKDNKSKTKEQGTKKKKKKEQPLSETISSNADDTNATNSKSLAHKKQGSGSVQVPGKDPSQSSVSQSSEGKKKKKKLKRPKLHLGQGTTTASGDKGKKAKKKTRKEDLKKLMSSYRLSKYGLGPDVGKELNQTKKKKKKKMDDS